MSKAENKTATLDLGKRITAGKGEDRDSGRIDAIAGDQVTVSWDSGVVTTQSAAALVDCCPND